MKNKGFTVIEVMIACGLLSLFMAGLMTLYSSGSKMGNSAMWLQSVTAQLKNAAREISTAVRKGSYPSRIVYPQTIIEANQSANFRTKFRNGELKASSAKTEGTRFLLVTESVPERQGRPVAAENNPAELRYHIFALKNNGELVYTQQSETLPIGSINNENYAKAVPAGAVRKNSILVKDVESIECIRTDNTRNDSPIQVTINCAMPKHKETKRTEIAIGTPNVTTEGVAEIR